MGESPSEGKAAKIAICMEHDVCSDLMIAILRSWNWVVVQQGNIGESDTYIAEMYVGRLL